MKKLSWIDLRNIGELADEITEEALHVGVSAFVVKDAAQAGGCRRARARSRSSIGSRPIPRARAGADHPREGWPARRFRGAGWCRTRRVHRGDGRGDARARELSTTTPWLLVEFLQDPSKIPLEILLAAADQASGEDHGRRRPGGCGGHAERAAAREACCSRRRRSGSHAARVDLQRHGRGSAARGNRDRRHAPRAGRTRVRRYLLALRRRGILVGSYSTGMILISSETHPLPYMPTRPFRVNAAALIRTSSRRTTARAISPSSNREILAVNVQGGRAASWSARRSRRGRCC